MTTKPLLVDRSWQITADGDAYRRVVASQEPQAVAELHTIERIVDDDVIVIAAVQHRPALPPPSPLIPE